MDLQEHVTRIEDGFEELDTAVAELDRATDRLSVRVLVWLGVHPGTDTLQHSTDRLGDAIEDFKDSVWGPNADLDDSVQVAGKGPTDDWEARRLEVFRRDDWSCRNCGHTGGPTGDADLHAHHVVPVARGGRSETSNIVTLCERCHRRAHGG